MPKKIKFEDHTVKTDAMKNYIDTKYSKNVNKELALSKVKNADFYFKIVQNFYFSFSKKLLKM